MNPIKGLLQKDYLLLKSYSKNLVVCLAIFVALIVSQSYDDGMSSIGAVMIMLVFSMLVLSTFSYDEKSKADRYLLTLPISRKEIVIEKYILSLLSLIVGTLVGSMISLGLIYFLLGEIPDIEENLSMILGGMVGVALIQGIQLPCIYKWGAEKGRIQIYIIGMVIFVIGILLSTFAPELKLSHSFLLTLSKFIPVICIGLIAIIYYISYKISYKIYKKKEY